MLILHDFYMCTKNVWLHFTVCFITSSVCTFVVFTKSRVVLSHLNFFNTVSRKPTSPSFNASFPESSFTNGQNCGSTARGRQHLCTRSTQIISTTHTATLCFWPLTLSPRCSWISPGPWGTWDRVAMKVRPGTALYSLLFLICGVRGGEEGGLVSTWPPPLGLQTVRWCQLY